jgi:hypothetical protein
VRGLCLRASGRLDPVDHGVQVAIRSPEAFERPAIDVALGWPIYLCPTRRKLDESASFLWAADAQVVTRRPQCGARGLKIARGLAWRRRIVHARHPLSHGGDADYHELTARLATQNALLTEPSETYHP